ncbi:hypothetical protein WJX75_007661 [Coccomyxa subellipsoidea]
MTGAQ